MYPGHYIIPSYHTILLGYGFDRRYPFISICTYTKRKISYPGDDVTHIFLFFVWWEES